MRPLIMAILCTLCSASITLADGDTAMRKMKGPEAAAFSKLQTSIQAALPKNPPNYTATKSGFDMKEVPAYLAPDEMAGMQFKSLYTLNQGVGEAGQRGALEDMMKGTPEQQARRAALNDRTEKLQKDRKTARNQGEKDRIKAELKKISTEESALDEEIMSGLQANLRMGFAGSAIQNITNAVPPKELTIRVIVNKAIDISAGAYPYTLKGAPLAFAQNEFCPEPGTYCITALLGNYDQEQLASGTTQYTPKPVKLGIPTRARGMAVIVSSPADKPESAQELVKKVDLAKLKALLP